MSVVYLSPLVACAALMGRPCWGVGGMFRTLAHKLAASMRWNALTLRAKRILHYSKSFGTSTGQILCHPPPSWQFSFPSPRVLFLLCVLPLWIFACSFLDVQRHGIRQSTLCRNRCLLLLYLCMRVCVCLCAQVISLYVWGFVTWERTNASSPFLLRG